jgi:3-hydroxybutyryl-CoA dehydrogenase
MPEIQTIAVIGADAAGRALAHVAARGGYRVILEDILPASLRRAESEICKTFDQAVAEGVLRQDAADVALARIEYASSVEQAARQADLVIESVPDELESKLEMVTLLDKICRPHTILASTTSSLSIGDLASVTYRPQKCLGLRFGSAERLELTRGAQTDDETVTACVAAARRMVKDVVVLEAGA